MTLLIIFLCLVGLVLMISWLKFNPFLAFLIAAIAAGLLLGLPVKTLTKSVEKGIGDTLGSIVIIIAIGAMMGKLVAESGAAQKIASVMMNAFGIKYIQWALLITGFIIGIPLFYGVGFVLMVPLIFTVVYKYKVPAVYTGLPMIAALSVTFGFLPPHPAPSALVVQFGANMGLTLLYGIIIGVPAVVIAGPLFSKTLKDITVQPLDTFKPKDIPADQLPGGFNSFVSALLPVILLMITTLIPFISGENEQNKAILAFFSEPSIVMLVSLGLATVTLGLRQGKNIKEIMNYYGDAVKDVVLVLLVIGGAGALKQVLIETGVSKQIAEQLGNLPLPPLALGWMMAAIIRVAVGSATVAGFTAAGIIAPLITQQGVNPNLMVLAIGSGSLFLSHVNDSGFWLFKEYFNLSIKETLRSWSTMEIIISLVGLMGVLLLNLIV
jgi:Gnt-I system high-affinity gluconate transporter